MRNGDNNLVILTFYIIGVVYTLNRMVESITDKIKFEYKKAEVDDYLKEQNLQDDIGISFKFQPSYELDDVKDLLISIENKSQNLAVYVDWDNCSLVVEHSKESRRVIRKSPDVTRDLGVPQSPSLVAPTKTLTQGLTSENVFERDITNGTYSPKKPIVDITGLGNSQVKALKKLYADFMDGKKNLDFSLQLVLRLSEVRAGIVPGEDKPPLCIINCPFTIRKLPWTYALPWNKKK